jgi:ketosteroid isomerase-like protein
MRSLGVSRGILVCALALAALPAVAEEAGAAAVDAVWMKAMKANDLDAVVGCYAPDAVLWLPDAPEARGPKEIRDVYAGYFSNYTVTDASLPNATYQTSSDLSASWGNFILTLQPKNGGDPVVLKGRFIVVAKRIGGRWLYVADHASANPPPPPATKP